MSTSLRPGQDPFFGRGSGPKATWALPVALPRNTHRSSGASASQWAGARTGGDGRKVAMR